MEFSRLCIAPAFRRIHATDHFNALEPESPAGNVSSALARRSNDEILLRLILGFIAWAKDNDVSYCYFLITAALARILSRFHLPLAVAGPEVDHRGMRRPYRTHVERAFCEMLEKVPQVRRLAQQGEPYVSHRRLADPDRRARREHVLAEIRCDLTRSP